MSWKQSFRREIAKFDGRIVVTFMLACMVIITYQYYFQSPIDYFQSLVRKVSADEALLYQSMAWHLGSFFMLMIVPITSMGIMNRFSARKFSPYKYTFKLGDYKTGIKLALLFAVITVGIHLLLVAFGVIVADIYPACKSQLIRRYFLVFVLFECSQCLYMTGFEYFFRGFLLIEAQAVFGNNALAITLLPYIIIKFGKPPVEIYTAIIVGLVLGYMTIRTRSFWYAALAHSLLATAVDVFAVYAGG
ncbi:MAG: CPBP family intramembrane metalloprotease [Desulfobacteraceae bacterium]|nr:CPBP family intramembrane metalloprotease [Desulfobacteraceae bacterium]